LREPRLPLRIARIRIRELGAPRPARLGAVASPRRRGSREPGSRVDSAGAAGGDGPRRSRGRRRRGPLPRRQPPPADHGLPGPRGGGAPARSCPRPRVLTGSLVLAAGATLALMAAPPDGRSLLLLFAAGFLVFGPFPSFTVLGAELLGPRAVGAGVGFMNGVGYGTAALGDVVMGAVIDATGGTGAVFEGAAAA